MKFRAETGKSRTFLAGCPQSTDQRISIQTRRTGLEPYRAVAFTNRFEADCNDTLWVRLQSSPLSECACVRVRVCVRACVRACVKPHNAT